MPRKKRVAEFDPEVVRDISAKVYSMILDKSCEGDAALMVKKDGDNGEKLRERSGVYDGMTRMYMRAMDEK